MLLITTATGRRVEMPDQRLEEVAMAITGAGTTAAATADAMVLAAQVRETGVGYYRGTSIRKIDPPG